jgi:hypothetical protein
MHLQRGRELNTVRISLGIGTIIAAPKPRRVFEQEKLSVLTSCESRFDVYAAIGRSLHDLGQLGAFEQMRPALWEASNRSAGQVHRWQATSRSVSCERVANAYLYW